MLTTLFTVVLISEIVALSSEGNPSVVELSKKILSVLWCELLFSDKDLLGLRLLSIENPGDFGRRIT